MCHAHADELPKWVWRHAHSDVNFQQRKTRERHEKIVESAPRERLHQHHEKAELHADQHGFDAARAVCKHERQPRAQKRDDEKRKRTFHRFLAVVGRVPRHAVSQPDQRADRIGEREHQNRNAEEQLVAARRAKHRRDGDRKINLAKRHAPHPAKHAAKFLARRFEMFASNCRR